mgnify:CR=1 FL=1
MLTEPWDVFALWLPLAEADLASASGKLTRFFASLTPDIAVCGVLLSESSGCRWLLRTLRDQTVDVVDAEPEHDAVGQHEQHQRAGYGRRRYR